MRIHVECRAEGRGEETPRALVFGRRRVSVVRELDRWLAPDHRYFKVSADDGYVYIVRQDMETLGWEMTFARGEGQGT